MARFAKMVSQLKDYCQTLDRVVHFTKKIVMGRSSMNPQRGGQKELQAAFDKLATATQNLEQHVHKLTDFTTTAMMESAPKAGLDATDPGTVASLEARWMSEVVQQCWNEFEEASSALTDACKKALETCEHKDADAHMWLGLLEFLRIVLGVTVVVGSPAALLSNVVPKLTQLQGALTSIRGIYKSLPEPLVHQMNELLAKLKAVNGRKQYEDVASSVQAALDQLSARTLALFRRDDPKSSDDPKSKL